MKTTSDCIQILRAGANLVVKATKPTQDLVQMARVAASTGVHLTIMEASKPAADLVQIARAGKEYVTIDISK